MRLWLDSTGLLARLKENQIARNTGWMFAGEAARFSIQAVYFVVIARQLGSGSYGAFASVVAMVSILGSFASWGWGNLLIKYVSRDRGTFAGVWGQTLCVGLISGGSLCVVAVLASSMLFSSAIPLSLTCSVALADLIFFRIVTLSGHAYVAHERLDRTAVLHFSIGATRLCAAGFMVVFGSRTATDWGVLYCMSTATVALASLWLVTKELGAPNFGVPFRQADFVEGFHFSVSLSSATIYNDLDKTMLGRLGTFDAVGIYSAAYRGIEAAFIPVRSLLFATYAKFFQKGASGIDATSALARRLVVPSLAYAVLASALLAAAAPLVPEVLGGSFAESSTAVRFLAPILVFRAIQVFASDALTGAGYQHWRSSLQFLVALINVALNLLLIPIFSWHGAAFASLLCDAVLAVGMWVLVWYALQRSTAALNDRPLSIGESPTGV